QPASDTLFPFTTIISVALRPVATTGILYAHYRPPLTLGAIQALVGRLFVVVRLNTKLILVVLLRGLC
ncbi:hypothetical protein DFS33DRAFT_1467755, partial [Desarmillaria ectypa]